MARSRATQNTDITRIVGILLLEVLAAIVLLNLAGVAQQQRTQMDVPNTDRRPTDASMESTDREPYPYPEAYEIRSEKSLPKVAAGRYNDRW